MSDIAKTLKKFGNRDACSAVLCNPKQARKTRGATQTEFWSALGVTQSAGSRYETGREMDKPLRALLILQESGILDEADMKQLMALASN